MEEDDEEDDQETVAGGGGGSGAKHGRVTAQSRRDSQALDKSRKSASFKRGSLPGSPTVQKTSVTPTGSRTEMTIAEGNLPLVDQYQLPDEEFMPQKQLIGSDQKEKVTQSIVGQYELPDEVSEDIKEQTKGNEYAAYKSQPPANSGF